MVTWLQIQFFLVIGMGLSVTNMVTKWLHWLQGYQVESYESFTHQMYQNLS